MSTEILTTFHSRENFDWAVSKILKISPDSVWKVGVSLTRKMKAHTIWVSHRLTNGWTTTSFVSRASFSGFDTEEAEDSIQVTSLSTGMRFNIHLKNRLQWDEPIASNLRCSCSKHKDGQPICEHIAHVVTTKPGMKLASRLDNLRAEHQERLEELQRQHEEIEQRRRESLERQETWVQKNFHLKNGYRPAPGFWLDQTSGKGEENFDVICQVESWGWISTEKLGTICTKGEWFTFYNRRCDFGDLMITPENLELACKELFHASPHSQKTLCFDWEMEMELQFP